MSKGHFVVVVVLFFCQLKVLILIYSLGLGGSH